jgi:hypothetical protein
MSKAYDTIHIPLLKKALKRLNIPEAMTDLIINIFTDRSNYVITNLDLTESYEVEDGIDQGETIALLLWCIYYDLLLTAIYNNTSGYILNTTYTEYGKTKNLQAKLPALAYIDDAIWIAKSKQELQSILKTASSFFALTNIKVNPNKSVLVVTNSNDSNLNIVYNNTTIEAIQPREAFHFLGCWYTTYKNHKPIFKIIKEEANSAIRRIKNANITEKQAIYIINTVILTRIAYRVQNTYLSTQLYKAITNYYTTIVKHKAGLARTVPNSTLFHHQIYGL